MRHRTSFPLGVLAGVLLLAPAEALAGPTLSHVRWESGPESGSESLVLSFSSGVPDLEVQRESWGLSVWLPGMKLEDIGAEGIRVVGEAGGMRLKLERPGVELRSVKLEPDTVRLSVRRGPGGAPGAALYRIGPGDVVTVAVYKNADLSGDFTVAPDGTLSVPLIGAVPVRGLTDTELSAELTQILSKDFLVDPQVSVTVKTYQSQWVYVSGSVARAVRIPISPDMGVKDVLSEAGIALGPGQEVTLTRAAGSGETFVLDASRLEAPGCPVPRDGDVLNVQEPSYIFVQGEVRRPGRYALSPDMTILQAISIAEGLTEWASKKDVRVRRVEQGGTVDETVNLKKVEVRKVPDLLLKPGDIILIKRKVL